MVTEDALAATADKALAVAGIQGVRGWISLSGAAPDGEWEDIDPWWQEGPGTPPDVAVADDDPLRLMYTSGTESRPKGVLLSSRSLITQYASCAIDGGMSDDDIEVHALPMYHCAQLDVCFNVDVYLAPPASSCPAPTRRRCWPRSRGRRPPSCSARRRCGSRCCGTPTSTAPTCPACARPTTAPHPCPSKCSVRCGNDFRAFGCGTCTGRPSSLRWRPCCARTSSSATSAAPGVRRCTSRRWSSTTRTTPCPPGGR